MTIHQVLKKYWNYDNFRPLQEDIILSVLNGRDTLALMPTGGGKSICFQVPALVREGICIVVSPLIALMKDQVEQLSRKGIPAVSIVSGMSKREVDILLDNCVYGGIKFLYLSPERLMSDLVRERIQYMPVNLFAIDEAHCISQWGYDFRPPYLSLALLRQLHPDVPMLALTATATGRVVKDIQEKLLFKEEHVLKKSFERKNLSYVVSSEENKLRKLLTVIKNVPGAGVVYVRNRKETQELAYAIQHEGYTATFYHAGLDANVRSQRQMEWQNNKTRIIVATNAFGMGIDKPDVRFVIHYGVPESLEAYYQEAGRAGRDEKRAYALLLYNDSDKAQLYKKFEASFPEISEIKRIYNLLGNYYQLAFGAGEGISFDMDVAIFSQRFKLDPIVVLNAFKFLEQAGYIVFTESVFLPARIKFIVTAQELYKFQIEYSALDLFIKALLRNYGELFDSYISINEADLARKFKVDVKEIYAALQQLKKHKVMAYYPKTDLPQLFFSMPRAALDHVQLDGKYIRERKKIRKEQLESVIAYAEGDACRSVTLLNYFDEATAQPCGSCDWCIAQRKAQEKSDDIEEKIEYELLGLLAGNKLVLEKLIAMLSLGDEEQRLQVFRNLLDAGKLKTDGNVYWV